MQRQDVHLPQAVGRVVGGQQAAQAGYDVVHLPGAGGEDEDVAGVLMQCRERRGRDVRQELAGHAARPQAPGGPGRRGPVLGDRVEDAGHLHQRGGGARAAQQPAQAYRVQGRGHGHQDEVLAQGAGVQQEGEQEVGLQAALVDLVQDDGGGPGKLGVGLEAAQEQPGGDHLDTGGGAGDVLAAHRVAHVLAHLLAQETGQTAGGGPGGQAPGLGDNNAAGGGPGTGGTGGGGASGPGVAA